LVIKLSVDLVPTSDQPGDALVVGLLELEDFHFFFHLLELQLERELLFSLHSNVFNFLHVLVQVEFLEHADFNVFSLEGRILELFVFGHNLLDFFPILVVDGFGSKAPNQGEVLCKSVKECFLFHCDISNFWVVFGELLVKLEALLVPSSDLRGNTSWVTDSHELRIGPVVELCLALKDHSDEVIETFVLCSNRVELRVKSHRLAKDFFTVIELLLSFECSVDIFFEGVG
jgi:hypothetical protein